MTATPFTEVPRPRSDDGWREWVRVWALSAPAAVIAWYAAGPLGAAIAGTLLPVLLVLAFRLSAPAAAAAPQAPAQAELPHRAALVAAADATLRAARDAGRQTAVLVIAIDDAADLPARHGPAALDQVLRQCADRLFGSIREGDIVARLDGARFSVVLSPVRRADLELLIQLSARLQKAVTQPFSIDAATVYVSASVGFCLGARNPGQDGEALVSAAELALAEAIRNGPGGIRAYSVEIATASARDADLRNELDAAFDAGQIVGFFQPQLSTHTGKVTGFEVLARWQHPTRGVLGPVDFLDAVHEAGLSARLTETMIYQALAACRAWRSEGRRDLTVAVNFAREDLANPSIVDRIRWELDRFDITPAALTIEVLETVAAGTETDMVVRNIDALSRLGCRIDLDDFGTGHSSITSIRRFAVNRLKIDRSFVTRLDSDEGQRRVVSAILSMAERLGIETLAEGVENLAEHAMLAQLGCDYVQGFAIARPMPLVETAEWLARHDAKLTASPRIPRKAG
ncbi:MAG: hypothetical protein RLZZ528_149 [Pseudomonadota bacterium]